MLGNWPLVISAEPLLLDAHVPNTEDFWGRELLLHSGKEVIDFKRTLAKGPLERSVCPSFHCLPWNGGETRGAKLPTWSAVPPCPRPSSTLQSSLSLFLPPWLCFSAAQPLPEPSELSEDQDCVELKSLRLHAWSRARHSRCLMGVC